jgi:hypothetical protein
MKNTWTNFFRRLAAGCVISGATAWSSAMCYAVQLAYDDATMLAYQNDDSNNTNDTNPANNTDGWTAGDNGGFGFQPWNFDNDAGKTGTHTIDTTSTFDALKPAWRIALEPDITRAGRGFPALQTGQTLRMLVDNPTEKQYFRGYIIRLNSGGGNICYGGSPCTPGTTPKERLGVYTFEYFTYGNWRVSDSTGSNKPTALNNTDTAEAGVQIDITLTGPESYTLVMDPLGAAATYSRSGNLGNAGNGPINWLEFVFFNTDSIPIDDTDFFIKSLEIVDSAPTDAPGDYNGNGIVDGADYVAWRDHLGTSFQLANEVSGVTPGSVTSEDYSAWRARFGNTSGTGSVLAAAAVPEPGTLASCWAAMVTFCVAACGRIWRSARVRETATADVLAGRF